MSNRLGQSTYARYAVVVMLALLASATGLQNGFALDDVALVAKNEQVHILGNAWRLFASPYWGAEYGASLYRPVVTLGFALQWAVADGAPWVFHLASVVLYAASCALALAFLTLLVPAEAALVGAALFAVHPVHVEAVANVVGQGELIPAVAMLAAWVVYLRGRRSDSLTASTVVLLTVLYAVACFSKEHGILLPATIAALELFVVARDPSPPKPWRDRARLLTPLALCLGAVAVAYVVTRIAVLGDVIGEQSLVPVHGIRRVWIMLAAAAEWARLLAWPARLSADYSPGHLLIASEFTAALAPGVLVVVAAVFAFIAMGRGGHPTTATDRHAGRLALGLAAITLFPVANLVSVTLVAERTLFMPSIAATLGAAVLWSALDRRAAVSARATLVRAVGVVVAAALVVAGTWRSAERQRVWRDNATLFAQTVEDAPGSYRAHFFLGQLLFDTGRRAAGERRLRLAIELNPTPSDVSPLNYLATQYRIAGMCPQALPLYERAIAGDPARPDVRYGLAACLLDVGRTVEGRRVAEDGVRRGALRALFVDLLAKTDAPGRG